MQISENFVNIANPSTENDPFAAVFDQVAKDLNFAIDQSKDRGHRLRFIAKKIGVHPKTLSRISSQANRPGYITIFKIYRFLFNEHDDAIVLQRCPAHVAEFLKRANPQKIETSIAYSIDVEKEICQNPVAIEILILCATGEMSEFEIQSQFGLYGLKLANKLVEKNILAQSEKNSFCLGTVQMNMSPETVLTVGLQVTQSYAKPQKGQEQGQHFLGFYAEGLTPEAYDAWIEIDENAFKKKIEIAKNPASLGKKRAFAFCAVDTLHKQEDL